MWHKPSSCLTAGNPVFHRGLHPTCLEESLRNVYMLQRLVLEVACSQPVVLLRTTVPHPHWPSLVPSKPLYPKWGNRLQLIHLRLDENKLYLTRYTEDWGIIGYYNAESMHMLLSKQDSRNLEAWILCWGSLLGCHHVPKLWGHC